VQNEANGEIRMISKGTPASLARHPEITSCRVGKGAQRRAHADFFGAHASLCAPYPKESNSTAITTSTKAAMTAARRGDRRCIVLSRRIFSAG